MRASTQRKINKRLKKISESKKTNCEASLAEQSLEQLSVTLKQLTYKFDSYKTVNYFWAFCYILCFFL